MFYIIGLINPGKIKYHKRTSIYTKEHFDFLSGIVNNFNSILTCPNIITEIDNLLNDSLFGNDKYNYLYFMQEILDKSIEKYFESKFIFKKDIYIQYIGLTDSIILQMAAKSDLLISGDSRLCDHAKSLDIKVFDFKEYVNRKDFSD